MTSRACIFLLTILTESCIAQDYGSIDDIPIESYNHGDHQENHMDLELLPERRGRSSSSAEDPKEYFFRSMRSFDDSDDVRTFGPYQNIPRPSFQTEERRKRSAPLPAPAASIKRDKSLSGIVKNLGKPLEVVSMDTRNLTEKEDKAESRMISEDRDEDTNFAINDFIRFRRSTNENLQKQSRDQERVQKKIGPHSEKLMMEMETPNDRETRGATKDYWAKQVYPVRKGDEMSFDDNIPSSSENVRAPRVHFVTQKLADNGIASSDLRPYEREPRSRHLDRAPPRESPRDLARENSFVERRFRSYDQPGDRDRAFFRDELYSRYDPRDYRDAYRPRYENYDRTRNDYSPAATKPQKRIIYYATLPEISRSPPNVDLRDRYRYDHDRYDDRYLSDPYRLRKSYPKSRYEDEGKTPYPVKVLTDVNVREIKKNPERRIYSEVDRTRYAYNTPPYRAADG